MNALLTADAKWKAAVLDADALNALAAGELGQFPLLPTNTVLTPHPGEAARLLGCSVAQIQTDRPAAAQELAERRCCTTPPEIPAWPAAAAGMYWLGCWLPYWPRG